MTAHPCHGVGVCHGRKAAALRSGSLCLELPGLLGRLRAAIIVLHSKSLPEGMHMKGHIAAIVLVVLGVFFLLTNLGLISISLRELLRVWWPVALIAVGLALFFTPGDKKK